MVFRCDTKIWGIDVCSNGHFEHSSTFSQGTAQVRYASKWNFIVPCALLGFYCWPLNQTGACRLKVSYQLLEVLLRWLAIQRNTTEKWKNDVKGVVTFPSPHLAQQHLFSPLMMHVMLREASYKCLMTLDTRGALEKCCSLNFPPCCFFLR